MPSNFDDIYLHYAREGSRVLCLGYKELGNLTHQQLRDMNRNDVESELKFVGFVIISCPLKPDTKAVVKEILNSSHYITMITGDNPLTACHVASQLKLIDKRSAFVLSKSPIANSTDDDEKPIEWCWRSVIDDSVQKPVQFALEKENLRSVKSSRLDDTGRASKSFNYFCLTGEVSSV